MPDTFNTKYAECILKLNATILLNGFLVHGGKIWVGTVTDHTLGTMDGNQDMLVSHNARSLVDGGYTQSRYLDTPYDSPEIHPLRLRDGQTIEEYKAEAHEKKVYNTIHSHWRARVEHIFGRNLLGRFKVLNEWRYSLGFLEDAMACMMIAMNVELFLRHGNRGRYNPTTPEKIEALRRKAEHHVMQNVRYPYSDPLPCLKEEQAELQKEIALNRKEQESEAKKQESEEKKGGLKATMHEERVHVESHKPAAVQVSQEVMDKRREEAAKKREDTKRRLFLEQKELADLQKKNGEAQKRRKKRSNAEDAGEDPRISERDVEHRILKRIKDEKRRKRNHREETD